MAEKQIQRETAADFMVKSPVIVESWQPIAHARQLMLMHSFSFLPVYLDDKWKLLPEVSMARYLHQNPNRRELLAMPIHKAATNGLDLVLATVVKPTNKVTELLKQEQRGGAPSLWLVQDKNDGSLCGVLSPFDLM